MGRSKKDIKLPPATSPEHRESQLTSLAMDLAERQLREGTATSQVVTHFLKLASEKEKLEREILQSKKELMEEQTAALKSSKKTEELYEQALAAMQAYSGVDVPEEDELDE